VPVEAEMSAPDRRKVQAALQRLGYDPGPVDGVFGPLTRAAIRRFQQDRGDQATGSLTGEQASRLIATPGSVGQAGG
jgi:hydrogenase-4 component B